MILVPVFIVVFMMVGKGWATLAIFIVASVTDYFDGHLARKYNLITNYGKIMDPLADKLLVTSAFVCLIETGDVAAWMVIIILAREFAITGLRAVAASDGIVIAAAWSGKVKTVTQMLAVILLLMGDWLDFIPIPVAQIMLWIAVFMTLYSGVEYIYKNRTIFGDM